MIASQMTHFLSPSRLSNSTLDTFTTSMFKKPLLAFIWILLLNLNFMFIMLMILLLIAILGGVMPSSTTIAPNDITQTGVYIMSAQSSLPYGYGILVHIKTGAGATGYNAVQTFYKWDASQSWQRTKVDQTWRDWSEIAIGLPSFYKNYNDLASLQTALGVNTKLKNLGTLPVNGGATNTMDVGAYVGVLFIINQSSGHLSIIAQSYNNSTEIVHQASAGEFSASCVNKTLSITNNSSGQLAYSISLLL